jgi:single-stranded DNA-binding protein
MRQWTDKHEQKRYDLEIVADEVMFVDSKGEGSGDQGGFGASYNATGYAPSFSSQTESAPKFEEMSNDDDLPF